MVLKMKFLAISDIHGEENENLYMKAIVDSIKSFYKIP